MEKIKQNRTFQIELKETIRRVLEIKETCEANIVSIFWKNPDKLLEHDEIEVDSFNMNHWKVFFVIADGIIRIEEKRELDPITVGMYLEKHPKLSEKFSEYGGYATIEKIKEYVQEDNLEGYIKELHKWERVLMLAQEGYPINNRLSDFVDMSAEDIYNEFEVNLNHIFSNVDTSVKSYGIGYNIHTRIDEWDSGSAIGLPLYNLPLLTKELGGLHLGEIALIGGVSNSGKSSFVRLAILPSIMNAIRDEDGNQEKLVLFLNEEGIAKWQREMIIWVANNIYKKDIKKWMVRNGGYDKELKELLHKCGKYLEELDKNHILTLIPFDSYSTDIVIKQIRKYSALGVKYFIIDTFKMDNSNKEKIDGNTRLQMVQNMTNLYNVIKESVKNVSLVCTVQLTKASSRLRWLGLDSLAESKNIADVCAPVLLLRNLYDDEVVGDKALTVFSITDDEDQKGINVVPLDPEKKYQVIFIAKGRESMAGIGSRQIVIEVDHSRNIIREVGWTFIGVDF